MNKYKSYKNRYKLLLPLLIMSIIIPIVVVIGIMSIDRPKQKTYKVEYVKGYDDVIVQEYYKGEKINFPEIPTRKGYQFIGWSLAENENIFVTKDMVVNKEVTFYAKWQEQTYNLTYNERTVTLTYSDKIIPQNNSLIIENIHENITIENPQKEGYNFVGWKIIDGEEEINLKDFSFDKVKNLDLTIEPIFKEIILNFEIIGNRELYTLKKLSHNYKIAKNGTLSFDVEVKDCADLSDVLITSSSGVVNVKRLENTYSITINNFIEDFIITIKNLELNKYNIQFISNEETFYQEFIYGSNLSFPSFENKGFKLIGFKDVDGRYYSKEFIITQELILYAVWEELIYNIEFPKTNGMFIIKHNGELLTTNKIINKTYNETLEFEIVLSQAYSNSNIMVYALKNNTNIYPEIIDNNYIFNNIDSNMKIIVDNVELNSYSVTIDGTYYGDFGYGSWILVSGDTIEIKNILTNQITLVKTLIVDNDFAGWLCNDKILVNCIVQDICDDNSNIEIFGNYSKRVSKIKLVFNNGINDTKELLFVEGEPFELPTPIRPGYIFVGWFEKLVEVNTVVDEELSVKFEKLTNIYTILYAGWTK